MLNEAQQEAVNTINGPVLIIAGAGSGKTHSLISRIVNMYKHGINMNNVLMLTFTNKAADEMKMRAERELPGISNDLTACTFHSFCVKLLKEYGSMAGIGDFTILSENDSADAMDVAKNNMYEYLKNNDTERYELYKDETIPPYKKILGAYSLSVNTGRYFRDVLMEDSKLMMHADICEELVEAWKKYKQSHMYFTYDDLLVMCNEMLKNNKSVQDKVKQLTGHEPSKTLNPDECVAIGASIQGGKLSGEAGAGDILLLDVTPLSLSIETMGGIATRLIERNTTIPTKKSQIFSTAADNQTAVDINVVQGERQFARDNKSLGQFRLDGIPPARRGVPQIEVTFDIDANGIVNVSAKDLGTGKEQHITITAGSNMSDADIDKAVKEAAEFEAQDKKRKEAIDTRNNADSMVFQVENALKEAGDKIDANDKAAVEADLNALKDLLSQTANAEEMTDSQVADIKAAQEKMMESAQKLFAKMYEQTQQAGGQAGPDMNMGGGAAGSTDAGNNDDVVDADYKEV